MKRVLFSVFFVVFFVMQIVAQRGPTDLNTVSHGVLCTIEVEIPGQFSGPYIRTIELPGYEYGIHTYSISGPGQPRLQNFTGSTADVILMEPDLYLAACESESTELFLDLFVDEMKAPLEPGYLCAWYYIRLLVKRGW